MKNWVWIFMLLVAFSSCKKDGIDVLFQQIDIPTNDPINAIHFINNDVGFAVGGDRYQNGMIMKTTDGGSTWTITNQVAPVTFFDIDFLNDTLGTAVGYSGNIARTEDAGTTWSVINFHSFERLNGICMVDDQKTIITGGDGYSNGIIVQSNQDWFSLSKEDYEPVLLDITQTNNNTFLAAGYGAILKSVDAGNSWQFSEIKGDFYSSLSFVSPEIGYVCGLQGSIQKTTDGGTTWQKQKSVNGAFGERFHFEAIDFFDSENGICVGFNGRVFITQNGGADWLLADIGTTVNFNAAQMMSSETAIVGGDNGAIYLLQF